MNPHINVVFGGVGIIKGDITQASQAMIEITKEINPFLIEDGFLTSAPFKLINGIIRFGTKCDPYAQVAQVDKRHNELQFAVEVEMAPIKRATKDVVKEAFLEVIVPALFSIAAKYDLPTNGLKSFCDSKDASTS